jgi:hypothetical protein
MAKERSFWDWVFGSSCCSDRGKNYARKERDESKNEVAKPSKVIKSLEEEIENEPGSIWGRVRLDENSEYNSHLIGEGESDGSVEIR